jgi:hypothetical protein
VARQNSSGRHPASAPATPASRCACAANVGSAPHSPSDAGLDPGLRRGTVGEAVALAADLAVPRRRPGSSSDARRETPTLTAP